MVPWRYAYRMVSLTVTVLVTPPDVPVIVRLVVALPGGTIKLCFVSVTTAVCGVVPSLAVAEAGTTVQVDFFGSPEHANATA